MFYILHNVISILSDAPCHPRQNTCKGDAAILMYSRFSITHFFFSLTLPALAILFCVQLLMPVTHLYGQRTKSSQRAGEQVKAEKGLKDNRYYFYFINTAITNKGTDEEKKQFKEAIQRDIIAQLLYMRFHFKESYIEIRKSQKILVDTYRGLLLRDVESSRSLLNNFAHDVFRSGDPDARSYLKFGYRDLKVAMMYLGMGDNIRKSLYSMRLNKYVEAIKTAKHGMRYALLSRLKSLEVNNADALPGPIYSALRDTIISFQKATESRDERTMSFNNIRRNINLLIPENERKKYLLIHHDSYYRTPEETTFYEQIWAHPDLDEIKDYKHYRDTLD